MVARTRVCQLRRGGSKGPCVAQTGPLLWPRNAPRNTSPRGQVAFVYRIERYPCLDDFLRFALYQQGVIDA